MNAPMMGSWVVQVQQVRPFSIHGDEYFELYVSRVDEPSQPMVVRVARHALSTPPQAGQRLELSFLMGQVTSARVVSD